MAFPIFAVTAKKCQNTVPRFSLFLHFFWPFFMVGERIVRSRPKKGQKKSAKKVQKRALFITFLASVPKKFIHKFGGINEPSPMLFKRHSPNLQKFYKLWVAGGACQKCAKKSILWSVREARPPVPGDLAIRGSFDPLMNPLERLWPPKKDLLKRSFSQNDLRGGHFGRMSPKATFAQRISGEILCLKNTSGRGVFQQKTSKRGLLTQNAPPGRRGVLVECRNSDIRAENLRKEILCLKTTSERGVFQSNIAIAMFGNRWSVGSSVPKELLS